MLSLISWEGTQVKCNKCGQEIYLNQEHICEGISPAKRRPIAIAKPSRSSAGYFFVQTQDPVILTKGFHIVTPKELSEIRNRGRGLKSEFTKIFRTIKETFKHPTAKNLIMLGAALITILVWAITVYDPYFNYMPAYGMKGFLAVLFGTYNNVLARTLHFSSVFTMLSVFIPQLLKEKMIRVGSVPSAIKGIAAALKDTKQKEFGMVFLVLGLAYVFSNFMMRNNSINKYLACGTFGIALVLSGSELRNTTFFRVLYALIYDIKRLVKKPDLFSKNSEMIRQVFGLGTVSAILLSLMRKILPFIIGDYIGYILGSILFVLGVVLMILNKKK